MSAQSTVIQRPYHIETRKLGPLPSFLGSLSEYKNDHLH